MSEEPLFHETPAPEDDDIARLVKKLRDKIMRHLQRQRHLPDGETDSDESSLFATLQAAAVAKAVAHSVREPAPGPNDWIAIRRRRRSSRSADVAPTSTGSRYTLIRASRAARVIVSSNYADMSRAHRSPPSVSR